MTQFTKQDAEHLIQHAQTAPLANLRHAEQVSALLQRFAAWYEEQTAPKPPTTAVSSLLLGADRSQLPDSDEDLE